MKLAAVFGSGMVLQRGVPAVLFGTGSGTLRAEGPGFDCTFVFNGASWCAALPPQPAGGPHTLRLWLDGCPQTLDDVWFGDVFLASGQSNMAFKLADTPQRAEGPSGFARCFTAPKPWPDDARPDDGRWVACTQQNAAQCTAIGTLFARQLSAAEGVPVGIVDASQGASVLESWLPAGTAGAAEWRSAADRCIDASYYPFNADSWLWNSLLAPLVPLALRGVLWYQGESNRGAGEVSQYARRFCLLVDSWRSAFGAPSLPFFTVQLAPFADPVSPPQVWPALREQQRLASVLREGVWLVPISDAGDAARIHPLDKRTPAQRLCAQVRGALYGGRAPRAASAVAALRRGRTVEVIFDAPLRPLAAAPAPDGVSAPAAASSAAVSAAAVPTPTSTAPSAPAAPAAAPAAPFEALAGGVWQPVPAAVRGRVLALSCPAGTEQVRMGWAAYAPAVLFSQSGWPALAFWLRCEPAED